MPFRLRLLVYCLLLVPGLALSLLILASKTEAFEPWNQRHHPYAPVTMPLTTKVAATATLTWQAVDQYGWPEWAGVVSRSLDTSSPDANSLGRVYNRFLASEGRGQITVREHRAGERPDLQHFAVQTAFLEAKCGSWATACVYITSPLPVPAYHKAAAMITWSYTSRAAVVRHETNHPLARACDQYRGGCPLAATGAWEPTVQCTGNPDTLMDCGGAARTATSFDYVTFKTAYPAGTAFLQVQAPDCGGPQAPWGGVWDPCRGLWVGPGGWDFDPASGVWQDKAGISEWCCEQAYGGEYNRRLGLWFWTRETTWTFDPGEGAWRCARHCLP